MRYLLAIILLSSCTDHVKEGKIKALTDQLATLDANLEKNRVMIGIDTTFCNISPNADCERKIADEARGIVWQLKQKDSLEGELIKLKQ